MPDKSTNLIAFVVSFFMGIAIFVGTAAILDMPKAICLVGPSLRV